MTPTPDLGVDQPVSSVARETLREAVEAMGPETAWNDLSADQQALVLRWLATPAGPEERGEGPCWFCHRVVPISALIAGYDTFEEQRLACLACNEIMSATPAPDTGAEERSDHAEHFDPACEECAYLARPTRETLSHGAEERLRAALENAADALETIREGLLVKDPDAIIMGAESILRHAAREARRALHDSAPSGTREETENG